MFLLAGDWFSSVFLSHFVSPYFLSLASVQILHTCHVKVRSCFDSATSRGCRSACSDEPDKCSNASPPNSDSCAGEVKLTTSLFYLSKVCSITFVCNFFIFPKFCSNFFILGFLFIFFPDLFCFKILTPMLVSKSFCPGIFVFFSPTNLDSNFLCKMCF